MSNLDAGRADQAPDPSPAPVRQVYLDHAATTPMLPAALAAMTEELAQIGNPSSLHNSGRRARRVVEESREQIAEAYGATGMRFTNKKTLVEDMKRAIETPGPVVVDVRVTPEENTYPMIPAGHAAREMVG